MPLSTAQLVMPRTAPVTALLPLAQLPGVGPRLWGCVSFAGGAATDVIDVSIPAQCVNLAQATYACWVYARSSGGGGGGRIMVRNNGGALFQYNAGSVLFQQTFSTTSGVWNCPSTSLILAQWRHIIITYDRTNVANAPTYYVNGAVAATTVTTAPVGSASSDASSHICVGNNTVAPSGIRAWDGFLADFRIYNRLLASSEAADLFLTGNRGLPGCVLLLPLDDGNLTTAYDLSGFATNGTISTALPATFVHS